MAQIDTMLGHLEVEQIRQFIKEKGYEEELVNFVARDNKKLFQEWLGWGE